MPAGGSGSAIVVERADRALVVRSAHAGTAATGLAAALPPEPSRTTVVVDASAAKALHALDDKLLVQLRKRLYADAPPGWGMRLVAARTGRPDPSGEPPVAARLADRLCIGVVAPDGELIALRGGELFSAGPGAGWLGFRQGGDPDWSGPRYPAPAWQAALPREFRAARPRPLSRLRARDRRASSGPVTVTAIPAGLWVRGAGTASLPLVDLGFGVPVEPARPIVLVGAPGEQAPGIAELVAFFESLPPVVRVNAVLVPYGQPPEACAVLAQSLADRLDITLRAYHALPHYTGDGVRRFAVFNATGAPERLTQTPERVYAPASAVPPPWAAPSPGTGVHEPDVMELPTFDRPVAPVAAPEPDDRGVADDFEDDDDPVVFEAPTPPLPAPDNGAFAGTAEEDALWTSAGITVDAQGMMRPMGGSAVAPARARSFTAEAGASVGDGLAGAGFAPAAESGVESAAAVEPGESVAAGARRSTPASVPAAPSAFQTTASTVLPETRPLTRSAGIRSQATSPATPMSVWPLSPLTPASTESAVPTGNLGRPWWEEPPVSTPPREARASALGDITPAARQSTASWAPARAEPSLPDGEPGNTPPAVPPVTLLERPRLAVTPVPDLLPGFASVPQAEASSPPEEGPSPPEEGPAFEASEPAVTPPAPQRDYDRLWLAGRLSTPQERQTFRASLGWRYDAAVRSVARLLAEHPGLRSAEMDDAMMTELAAVRVFVTRDEAELVDSIRSGGDERDGALAVCAAAGIRRLPSFRGVVVRGGPADASAADAYRPGQDLVEAAPLIALDDEDASVPGAVEVLIWSATARRLDGFVEERTTPEVVFLPGTVFRVLAVDPPDAPGARRILLAEVPLTKAGPGQEEWTARIQARLEEAAAARAMPSGDPDGPPDRFAPLPGDPARSVP